MNIDFKLPELGENIHSGDVVNVLVQEGDVIAANDGVVELETDKAVVEIPCPHAGRVAKLLVKKGDTVKVGQAILTHCQRRNSRPTGSSARRDVRPSGKLPRPPARPRLPSRPATGAAAGRARPPRADSRRPVGPPSGTGARRRSANRRRQRKTWTHHSGRSAGGIPGLVCGRPQHGCPPPAGDHAAHAPAPVASSLQPAVPPGESGKDAWGPVRVEKISRIRRTIAEQMARSAATIPHVTNFDDADVTELERLRQGVPAASRARTSSSR